MIRMALWILSRHSRQCKGCLPASSSSSTSVRVFSSFDERKLPHRLVDVRTMSQDSTFSWPDTRLGPLEPSDGRFPLPGMVGSRRPPQQIKSRSPSRPSLLESELITEELPYERHSSVIEQFITVNQELARKSETVEEKSSPFEVLECLAQECPYFLRNDFQDMFPNISFTGPNVTIITLHEKQYAANLASDPVSTSLNRVTLIEQFIKAATDLCDSLHTAGYWADFIDPTSGRPYLAHNTSALLYEKDHQYRELGFEISQFSGCRVIDHHQLGTRPYVGCIFTKAPLDHPLIATFTRNSQGNADLS